ncbi:MAG: anti-sigma factor [Pseudomonadota bacterium]
MTMRYDDEELQDRLASEFVLGNLRGGARRRLVSLMRRHPGLRDKVGQWEERLYPLILCAPAVKAPRRIWRAVHARIAPAQHAARRWRRLALAGLAFSFAVVLYLGVLPRPPAVTTVAVLNDQRASPGIVVYWTARQAAERRISVRVVAHPDMPPGTSWQAWLLGAPGEAPVSLGLVGTEEHQVLTISAAAARLLPRAVAIGVSVEPKGGSARPSGPFLFEGPAVRIEG